MEAELPPTGRRSRRTRRGLAVALGIAVVLAGGLGAFALFGGDSGPIPSPESLRRYGFAAWPEDTVEEGIDSCNRADDWQLAAESTIHRFVTDVLNYPPPVDIDLFESSEHRARGQAISLGTKDVFLGSILTVRRMGRCWYVTYAEPREGGLGGFRPTYLYREDDVRLVLHYDSGFPEGEVGYGSWDYDLDAAGNREQVVIDPPPSAEAATGHYLFMYPDKQGVSEVVDAGALGAMPPRPPRRVLQPHQIAPRTTDKTFCRLPWMSRRNEESVIRHLIRWEFVDGIKMRNGYRNPTFLHKTDLSRHRWRLQIEDADLTLNFTRLEDRCWALTSMSDKSGPVIGNVRHENGLFALEIEWGRADEARIWMGIGGNVDIMRALDRIEEPLTFGYDSISQEPRESFANALVILYRKGRVVNAEFQLLRF